MIVFDDQINEALERIARTPDGRVLHIFLQRAMMALSPSPDSGALQVFEGGRRFANEIKVCMDKGLTDENAGPGKSNSSSDGSLVVIAPRGPVHTGGNSRGARRRVTANTGSGDIASS